MRSGAKIWLVASVGALGVPAIGCSGERLDTGPRGIAHAGAEGAESSDRIPEQMPAAMALPDPGKPPSPYGTKGEAHLFLGSEEVGYIFFTVLAPARAELAHVFFEPDPYLSVDVTNYYVSLVLERAAWRAGTYSGALGGRAAIELSTGAKYESDATQASVTATLARAGALGDDVYLDGGLTMSLAARSGGEPLHVEVRFN